LLLLDRLEYEAIEEEIIPRMRAQNAGKRTPSKVVAVIAMLAGTIAFVNVVRLITSSPNTTVSPPSLPVPLQADFNTNRLLSSLSASFVRIDQPDPPESGKIRLVLSMDASELVDLMDSYRRGFVPEVIASPDDGGVVMHNPNLCRTPWPTMGEPSPQGGAARVKLDWVVFVHTAPGNAEKRQILRETWANPGLFKEKTFRVAFFVGLPPPEEPNIQVSLCWCEND
jgi:hypothetical protein